MTKFALFDVDGVAIVKRTELFNDRICKDYGVLPELVLPLFKNEFYKCITGDMDLKEVLKPYAEKWGWKGTIDELLRYWWKAEEQVNQEVVSVIDNLRKQGIKCYLASDQEKNRAEYLLNGLGLKEHFDGAFISCYLGVRKTSPEYWCKVLEALGNPDPAEITFWDDEEENVKIAREAGINARLFKGVEDLK